MSTISFKWNHKFFNKLINTDYYNIIIKTYPIMIKKILF